MTAPRGRASEHVAVGNYAGPDRAIAGFDGRDGD